MTSLHNAHNQFLKKCGGIPIRMHFQALRKKYGVVRAVRTIQNLSGSRDLLAWYVSRIITTDMLYFLFEKLENHFFAEILKINNFSPSYEKGVSCPLSPLERPPSLTRTSSYLAWRRGQPIPGQPAIGLSWTQNVPPPVGAAHLHYFPP